MVSDFSSKTEITKWEIRRLVLDNRIDRFLRGNGLATWRKDGRFRENLVFNGLTVQREMIWHLSLEAKTLGLYYEDGRDLACLSESSQNDTHHCGEDVYQARLFKLSQDEVCIGWRGTGPRKDYIMVSRYHRIESGRVGPGWHDCI
jgi:hypothetical protein